MTILTIPPLLKAPPREGLRDRSPFSGARQRRAPLIVSENQNIVFRKMRCMSKILSALLLALSCVAVRDVLALEIDSV
jgi:hypothetical protein